MKDNIMSHNLLSIIKDSLNGADLTYEQANKIAESYHVILVPTGMGDTCDEKLTLAPLKYFFPEFNWRVILAHDRQYTRFVVSIQNPDPREYNEMSKNGFWDDYGIYQVNL